MLVAEIGRVPRRRATPADCSLPCCWETSVVGRHPQPIVGCGHAHVDAQAGHTAVLVGRVGCDRRPGFARVGGADERHCGARASRPAVLGSGARDRVEPAGVIELLPIAPGDPPSRERTATGPAACWAVPRVVQLAPPSVVSITAGFSRFPALLTPASQQVVAETKSTAFGHQVAAAQAVGVLSVHVCPPSVDSATAGLSCQVMPDAQQIEAEAQETAVTWNVDGRVA